MAGSPSWTIIHLYFLRQSTQFKENFCFDKRTEAKEILTKHSLC